MMQYPWGKGTPKWTRDAALNDSDKSFTVPAGKIWTAVLSYAQLTASAAVGNRVLMMAITDGTNELYNSEVTSSIAATQVGQLIVQFGDVQANSNVHRLLGTPATAANVTRTSNAPDMILPAGYVIHVWDTAAIDAAVDDLTVVLHYVEYDA